MDYKYKKGQVFGKRLKVPKFIRRKVYDCSISFSEYIEFHLEDKVPISCIRDKERKIVERFGIEKCKKLNCKLIDDLRFQGIDAFELLMSIDKDTDDINLALYELLKDKIRPSDYCDEMKELYSDRLIEINEDESFFRQEFLMDFNRGALSIPQIIGNWDTFKEKDLSYCLLHDSNNTVNITDSALKNFMENYKWLIYILLRNRFIEKNELYTIINDLTALKSEEEVNEYIKKYVDIILDGSHTENGNYKSDIEIYSEEFRELFKYSSLEEYLKIFNYGYYPKNLIEELKTLPEDYIFNIPIPFEVLLNPHVLRFIDEYGLKNVVDFDNECGHFFTNNDCEMLKLMFDMYLHYGGNEHDPNRTIYTKKIEYDENGKYIERPYTKEEFYEAMKRMIVYGPSDWNYVDKAPDYRKMTGEFREKNIELFISEEAPEELQVLFYTKSLTPRIIADHPEYVEFLRGKDLESCFNAIYIKIGESYNYVNLYKHLTHIADFDEAMKFIVEYCDILDIVYSRKVADNTRYDIVYEKDDDINSIKKKINNTLKMVIIEKGMPYPENIPDELKEEHSSLFLSDDAPQELKDALYSRKINSEFILSNPSYINYLKGIDLEVLYKYMPVVINDRDDTISRSGPFGYNRRRSNFINISAAAVEVFGKEDAFDVMLIYGKYIEDVYNTGELKRTFRYKKGCSKDEFLDEVDNCILNAILKGSMKYNEDMPTHFKNNNPTLFLSMDTPEDIRNKFYNREFNLEDFNNDPELIKIFGETNIACGFPLNFSWIIPLFSNDNNIKIANLNRLKTISAYSKIQDVALQTAFKEYIVEHQDNIDMEKIEYVADVLSRLSLSNSTEIYTFRKELATQILKSDDPIATLNEIEDVFIKNNIPTVGKIFSCFEILHPDFEGFNFDNSMISPVLKRSSTRSKKIIAFSDLIKASFGSNNRSVNNYIRNIDAGNSIYKRIKAGEVKYEDLSDDEKEELTTFCRHLTTLYNNSMKARSEEDSFTPSGNVVEDINELSKKLSPDGSLDYDLGDRVIKMFCGFTGIETVEQAKEYIRKKIKDVDARNRYAARSDMVLNKGDFVKGIGGITFLRNILQNGSISKEYLGSCASSDATPLDTDLSMIMDDEGTISEKIGSTAASGYGPIWFVLKNDDRFVTTRDSQGTTDKKNDMSKMEVFYTGFLGQGHYGIRTGFASSEIDYIVMDVYDPRVGLEIVMNGFYIPVANREGKIIFTPQDYDKLREKMSGLSYYGEEDYNFSQNLVTEDTEDLANQIEQSNRDVQAKREKINAIIRKSLEELGLFLKTSIDGDLSAGFVELIDTGSTGRGTNKPGDGDFDFMMRLDKSILSNPTLLNKLKQILLKNLGKENSAELTGSGDFRLKKVQLDADTVVDIDITFTEKTDKVSYSTDMALQDRLKTIKKKDPNKYDYVVANILLAKKVLKEAGVYKPNRGEIPQGGLGGVGIENWILQNGGSFIDAARSFVVAAEGRSFDEFKKVYQIWDFGENHLAERRGLYSHDNFVENNMSENGYNTMVQALKEYLKKFEYTDTDDKRL